MSREQLQAVQAPLKERYREDPDSRDRHAARRGRPRRRRSSCSVETGRALVEAGLHPASGGDGTLACSGDMLLQALVACAGVTLQAVATNRGIELGDGAHRRRGRSRLPRDAGRRPRRAGRLSLDPPARSS